MTTNTLAVNTARSSTGALPPPLRQCDEPGIDGSAISHNACDINRSDSSSTTRHIMHHKSLHPDETYSWTGPHTLSAGQAFEIIGAGHVRLNFSTNEDILTRSKQ